MRQLFVVLVYSGLFALVITYFLVLLPRHKRLLVGAIDAGLLPDSWVHYTQFPPRFHRVPPRERGNVGRLTMAMLRTRHEDAELESARKSFVRAYLAFGVVLGVLVAACAAILLGLSPA